jgi:chaperonin GroEL
LGCGRSTLSPKKKGLVNRSGAIYLVVVEKVAGGHDSFNSNAATEKYKDLVAAGVIGLAKVTRPAAAERSLASRCLMLTTEAIIADIPDEKGDSGTGGGMGM